jgi:hypothetical protein
MCRKRFTSRAEAFQKYNVLPKMDEVEVLLEELDDCTAA